MNIIEALVCLALLIIASAIVSSGEISLAAARKLKLQMMAKEGDVRADKVLKMQENSGSFITVVQIVLNAVAILGGIIGEAAISPYLDQLLKETEYPWLHALGSILSFIFTTASFILFADLMPKRFAINNPERVAVRIVGIMTLFIFLFKPIVWAFNGAANLLFKLFRVPLVKQEQLTSEDIYAMMDAGAEAGVIQQEGHYMIENIFDMQERTVTSAMTARDDILFFDVKDDNQTILAKMNERSHSRILVCDNGLENVLGYVESHSLLTQLIQNEKVDLTERKLLIKALFIPDTLSLYEVLQLFKSAGEDFAVIVNEYALVVGIITLKDVMSIVMGDLLTVAEEEQQIIKRDEYSWLIDGITPLNDVMKALEIDDFPNMENYETIGGFMMYSLRKIPKKTDFVLFDKYKFEIIDTEGFKIDQLLVSLKPEYQSNTSE